MAVTMKKNDIYEELLKISRRLGINIRHERGFFDGGMCNIKGEDCLVLNKRHTIEKKINVLAREIATHEFDSDTLNPKVRQILEKERIENTAVEELGSQPEAGEA